MAPQPVPQVQPVRPVIPGVPVWLNPHIGSGENQIAATVLKRARECVSVCAPVGVQRLTRRRAARRPCALPAT